MRIIITRNMRTFNSVCRENRFDVFIMTANKNIQSSID